MRTYRRRNRRTLVIILAGALAFCIIGVFAFSTSHDGVLIDRQTVRTAFKSYCAIAEKGDWKALYPMLVRDVREKIAMTYENMRRRAELIEKYYPPALKRQALEDIGPVEVRSAQSPDEFFAALVRASGRVALSVEDSMGSRLKRIDEDHKNPGHYRVVTLAGNNVEFVQGGDGLFELVPDPSDVRKIHREYLKSIEMLDATRKAVEAFKGTRQ